MSVFVSVPDYRVSVTVAEQAEHFTICRSIAAASHILSCANRCLENRSLVVLASSPIDRLVFFRIPSRSFVKLSVCSSLYFSNLYRRYKHNQSGFFRIPRIHRKTRLLHRTLQENRSFSGIQSLIL